MKPHQIGIGWLAATLALALPASALAAPVVPPGNSAATQYTEAFPTAGGPRTTHGTGNEPRSPSKVLGSRNARRLEAQGEAGRAAAEAAAQTAPASSFPGAERSDNRPPGHGGGVASPGDGSRASESPAAQGLHARPASGGASGVPTVISHATGWSGSGEVGLLLPLTLFAALIWAIAFWARRHRRTAI